MTQVFLNFFLNVTRSTNLTKEKRKKQIWDFLNRGSFLVCFFSYRGLENCHCRGGTRKIHAHKPWIFQVLKPQPPSLFYSTHSPCSIPYFKQYWTTTTILSIYHLSSLAKKSEPYIGSILKLNACSCLVWEEKEMIWWR